MSVASFLIPQAFWTKKYEKSIDSVGFDRDSSIIIVR